MLYRPLDPAEVGACRHLSGDFSQACAGICEWFAEVPLKAAQFLQQWLQDGLVTELNAGYE